MYTNINGMRSARYPLQGIGCNCTPGAPPVGQTPSTGADTIGIMLPVLGLAGLVLWLGSSAHSGRHMTTNRRRMRRNGDDAKASDFRVGQRVQLHPGTDRWMRGDRYGDVARVGRKHVHVKMDRSGQTVRVHPRNLLGVD
jgi:hypothetical protein